MRVKICCIASVEEANLAVTAGANAVGLVSAMPSGPGPIPDEQIANIVPTVPPEIETFLLTSRTSPRAIASQHRTIRSTTIQLVDRIENDAWGELRDLLPHVRLVQVVHVRGPESLDEARRAAAHVDALLLDSGNPTAAVRTLGGTGQVHDWRISAAIVDAVSVPVYLAGGLRAENVAEAVAAVRPFGVDVCSGVRLSGRLDPTRLLLFMDTVRAIAPHRGGTSQLSEVSDA